MKRILLILIVFSGLFYWSSCSNDFELIADWKDIPVVYALLSPTDTAHYIRVEKAFLDPETSAIELAQISDSIYYPNASVKLVRTSNGREYFFTRVDGNKEGYQREEGLFADSPNWLYKLKTNGVDTISPNTEYELIVTRDENSEPVTGKTTTVSEIRFATPTLEGAQVAFYNQSEPPTPMPFNISWRFDKDDTKIFDLTFRFFYDEMVNGEWVPKSFDLELLSNYSPPEGDVRDKFPLEAESFYNSVAANIRSESPQRQFRYVEIELIGGSQDFKDYFSVNQANTGLTSSQLIPNFTNLSEGYGLFASIDKIKQQHLLNLVSRDSLKNGQFTKHLNFQ